MSTGQSVARRGIQRPNAQPARTLLSRLCHVAMLPMIWHERIRHRRHLLTIDDRLLRDVGLTRRDVEREAGKRFWQR